MFGLWQNSGSEGQEQKPAAVQQVSDSGPLHCCAGISTRLLSRSSKHVQQKRRLPGFPVPDLRHFVDKLGFAESAHLFSTSFPVNILEIDSTPVDMSPVQERSFEGGPAESCSRVGAEVGPKTS